MNDADVFVCYCRQDEVWKTLASRFMEAMQRADAFSVSYWDDSQIQTGSNWDARIRDALHGAKAALLLVSADFLASEYIAETEVPGLLQRLEEEELRLFPLLVRPCPWEAFEWLRKLQLANKPDEPLSGCTPHRVEEILTDLVWDIGRHIEALQARDETLEEAIAASKETDIESAEAGATREAGFETPVRDGFHHVGAFLTNSGVVHLIESSKHNPENRPVVGLILIFRTSKQCTWIVATDSQLYCVLDDAKTAAGDRRVQWGMPLGEAQPVRVRPRPDKAAGLVDAGNRRHWLYSQNLHPDPELLKETIEQLIEVGRLS